MGNILQNKIINDPYENLSAKDKLYMISRKTIYNNVKQLIYKPIMFKTDSGKYLGDYKFIDMQKMKDYQYQKYIIPYDKSKDEYIVMDKIEYFRFLKRVYNYIPNINMISIIFNEHKNRMNNLLSVQHKHIRNIYDEFDIRIDIDLSLIHI